MALYWTKYLFVFVGGWAIFSGVRRRLPGLHLAARVGVLGRRVPEGGGRGRCSTSWPASAAAGSDERAFQAAVRRLPALPAPGHDEAPAVSGHPLLGGIRAAGSTWRCTRRSALPAARAGGARDDARAAVAERRADPVSASPTRRSSSPRAPSTTRRARVYRGRARERRPGSRRARLVWCGIWFWAATSKLNHHFPSVIMVMMNNGPFFPKWIKRRLFVAYPDDLRPSQLAVEAHMGTLTEYAIRSCSRATSPLVTAMLVVMVRLPRLHRAQQPDGHADRVEHPDGLRRLVPVRLPPRGERARRVSLPRLAGVLCSACWSCPLYGNFVPSRVSFLLAMRYYAGNWAYSIWLFRGDAPEARS